MSLLIGTDAMLKGYDRLEKRVHKVLIKAESSYLTTEQQDVAWKALSDMGKIVVALAIRAEKGLEARDTLHKVTTALNGGVQ